MDAGKATKAAWQMNPSNGGEVLLSNRMFDRWDFILLNSPEYIRLKNESFINEASVEFRAKRAITLDTNTLLEPGPDTSHYLYVENIDKCFTFNKVYNFSNETVKKSNKATKIIKNLSVKIYPNPSKDYIIIQSNEEVKRSEIFDMTGRVLKINGGDREIDIRNLIDGNYIIKIYDVSNQINIIKFTKK